MLLSVFFRFLLMAAIFAALLFGPAGRFDLPFAWAYLAILFAAAFVNLALMDRDLLKERMHPGPGGTDRALRWIAMPLMLAHFLVAGLDVGRFHWSDSVPVGLRVAGLIALAAGMALVLSAVHVNRFFSPVVRIQHERGHRLVTVGPYRWIRHPGYLGALLMTLCGGLALGSWWALAPAAGLAALMLRRAIIEDHFLHNELEGYRDYAATVRYRLLPGVW